MTYTTAHAIYHAHLCVITPDVLASKLLTAAGATRTRTGDGHPKLPPAPMVGRLERRVLIEQVCLPEDKSKARQQQASM